MDQFTQIIEQHTFFFAAPVILYADIFRFYMVLIFIFQNTQ